MLAVAWLSAVALLLWGVFDAKPHDGFFGESDKVDHLFAFAVVTLLGLLSIPLRWTGFTLPFWLCAAFLLEYLQGEWVAQRTFDIGDAWANTGGVVLAYSMVLSVLIYRRLSSGATS